MTVALSINGTLYNTKIFYLAAYSTIECNFVQFYTANAAVIPRISIQQSVASKDIAVAIRGIVTKFN